MRSMIILAALVGSMAVNAETVRVSITGIKFLPNVIQVRAGDTVEFTNDSNFTHTVTADPKLAKNAANIILPAGATPFHSGPLAPGVNFSRTFTVPGLYQYVCLPHEKHGMFGQVEVQSVE